MLTILTWPKAALGKNGNLSGVIQSFVFKHQDDNFTFLNLFQADSCCLRPGGFRGLCWSFWLKLLSGKDPSEWIGDWNKRRAIYAKHKSRFHSLSIQFYLVLCETIFGVVHVFVFYLHVIINNFLSFKTSNFDKCKNLLCSQFSTHFKSV